MGIIKHVSVELTHDQKKRLEKIRRKRKEKRKQVLQKQSKNSTVERKECCIEELERRHRAQYDLQPRGSNRQEAFEKILGLMDIDTKLINPDHLSRFTDEEQRVILERYYSKNYFQAMRVEYIEPDGNICPRDNNVLFRADTVFRNELRKGVLCCQRCHTIYENNKTGRQIDFTTNGEYLYVVKSNLKCVKQKHRISPAKGWVSDVWFNAKLIDIHYCFECGRYFITAEEYKLLQRKYSCRLIGNFKVEEGVPGYNFGDYESKLRACGYTVSQNVGLSERERHNVLRFIVDRQILSKKTIQSYLSYFKSIAKNRENMHIAVKKWSDDLTWISAYEVGKNPPVEIKGLKFL